MKSLKIVNQFSLKKLLGVFLGVTFIILTGTQMAHADLTIVTTTGIPFRDYNKVCFEEKLNSLMETNDLFRLIICKDPTNPADPQCDGGKTVMTNMFLASDGIYEKAKDYSCSSQLSRFSAWTVLFAQVIRPETDPTRFLEEEEQNRFVDLSNKAFATCNALFDCKPQPPLVEPVPGALSGGLAPVDQPPSITEGPAANDGPADPANSSSGGGCSISVLETPAAGSFHYAIFLALASIVRGIKSARKYLQK